MGNNEEKYETLKLENQICFPLYACAKEIIRKYKPYLDDMLEFLLSDDGQYLIEKTGENQDPGYGSRGCYA